MEWVVVVAAAVTGTLTILAGSVPKLADAVQERRRRKDKVAAARRAAFDNLRRLYAGAHPHLENIEDTTWVNIAALAADCIPYPEAGSGARTILIALIGREKVEVETLIDALPD